ncbi:MAG TPA: acyl-CoA dehydrogenase family protein [Acidimicrobiia bacterium]|nr:acyl-CoA dehydrogenase family protein [Acidimicrobiia bacterium]
MGVPGGDRDNVVPARSGDTFRSDPALAEAVWREAGPWAMDGCSALGEQCGDPDTIELGFAANEHPPVHLVEDRSGRRADTVEYHPSWHSLLDLAAWHGLLGRPWTEDRPGAHAARAGRFILLAQVEAGVTVPVSTTYASVPALRLEPELAAVWEPLVAANGYDPRPVPATTKQGALIGIAVTERTGGSDLSACTTAAEPAGGGRYELSGHKWLVSAPAADAFFVTARAPGGLSCFFVPRIADAGTVNGIRVDRLVDKLGNRSNATAEVTFDRAVGRIVGEEGRGVRALMTMAAGTRHDSVLGGAALLRLGVAEAIHHTRARQAFGRPLAEHGAMTAVLADLALEYEGAVAAALRLSRAVDEAAAGDGDAAAFRRIAVPILTYWIGKRVPGHTAEALECLGGAGYLENGRLARAYREAPRPALWDGSGNVQALDVMRALRHEPGVVDALLGEVKLARGSHRALDAAASALADRLATGMPDEGQARPFAGLAARTLCASLLVRFAPPAVGDAYCATRLGPRFTGAYGDLPSAVEADVIVDRALPQSTF